LKLSVILSVETTIDLSDVPTPRALGSFPERYLLFLLLLFSF